MKLAREARVLFIGTRLSNLYTDEYLQVHACMHNVFLSLTHKHMHACMFLLFAGSKQTRHLSCARIPLERKTMLRRIPLDEPQDATASAVVTVVTCNMTAEDH